MDICQETGSSHGHTVSGVELDRLGDTAFASPLSRSASGSGAIVSVWDLEWNRRDIICADILVFIPLFLCYMSIPLFASVPDEKKIRMFSYLAGAAFVLNSLVPFLLSVFHLSLKWPFHLETAGGYLMYVLLGYVLSRISLSRKHRLILYALALGGLLLHILGTYALSMNAGKIIQTYKGYLNVPCILYSIGIFIFFKENAEKMMRKSGG